MASKAASSHEEEKAIDDLIAKLLLKKNKLARMGEGNSKRPSSFDSKMNDGNQLEKEELLATHLGAKITKEEQEVTHKTSSSESYANVLLKKTTSRDGVKQGTVKESGVAGSSRTQFNAHKGNMRNNKAEAQSATEQVRSFNRGKERVVGKSYGHYGRGSTHYEAGKQAIGDNYEREEGEIIKKKEEVQRGGEKRKEAHGEWTAVKRKKSPPRGTNTHSQDPSDVQCFNCAEFGHTRYSCRNLPKCFKCQKSGHTAPFCNSTVKEGECMRGVQRASLRRCTVTMTRSMEQEENRLKKTALVATITKGSPSERDVVEEFKRRWPSLQAWVWSIRRLSSDSFLIPFPHEGKIQEVVSKGELEFDGFVLHFRRWSMQVGAWRKELIHRWIVISKLPVCCWEWDGFEDIVQGFAWLIEVDPRSTPRSRAEKARIKIGVFNESDIPTGMIAEIRGVSYELDFEVEGGRRKTVPEGDQKLVGEDRRDASSSHGPKLHGLNKGLLKEQFKNSCGDPKGIGKRVEKQTEIDGMVSHQDKMHHCGAMASNDNEGGQWSTKKEMTGNVNSTYLMDINSAEFKAVVQLAVQKQIEVLFQQDDLMQEERKVVMKGSDGREMNAQNVARGAVHTVVTSKSAKVDGTQQLGRINQTRNTEELIEAQGADEASYTRKRYIEGPGSAEGLSQGVAIINNNKIGEGPLGERKQCIFSNQNQPSGGGPSKKGAVLGSHILSLLYGGGGGPDNAHSEVFRSSDHPNVPIPPHNLVTPAVESNLGMKKGESGPMRSLTIDGETVYRMHEEGTTEDTISDKEEERRRRLRKYFETLDIFGRVTLPETGIRGTFTCNRGTHPSILDGVGDSMQSMRDEHKSMDEEEGQRMRTQELASYRGETQLQEGMLNQDMEVDGRDEVVPETQGVGEEQTDREEEMEDLNDICDSEEIEAEWKEKLMAIFNDKDQVVIQSEGTVEGDTESVADKKGDQAVEGGVKMAQRKSARQNMRWGDRVVGTKDLIEAAVKAKTPLPVREGMILSPTETLFDIASNQVLLQLISACGVNLGPGEEKNLDIIRSWERERRLAFVKRQKLAIIEEELITSDQ